MNNRLWPGDEQPGFDIGIVGIAGKPILSGQLVVRVAQCFGETGLVVAMLAGKDVHSIRADHLHWSTCYPIVIIGDCLSMRDGVGGNGGGTGADVHTHICSQTWIWIGDEQPGFDIGIVGIAGEPILSGQLVVGIAQCFGETGLVVAMLTGKDIHSIGAGHLHWSIDYIWIVLSYSACAVQRITPYRIPTNCDIH